jgi:hypothetical protein
MGVKAVGGLNATVFPEERKVVEYSYSRVYVDFNSCFYAKSINESVEKTWDAVARVFPDPIVRIVALYV